MARLDGRTQAVVTYHLVQNVLVDLLLRGVVGRNDMHMARFGVIDRAR